MRISALPATLALAAALAFQAQGSAAAPRQTEQVLPGGWSYASLHQGWSAGGLIGTEVEGLMGEELGEVVDLIVSPDGRLEAVEIEASGMLDVGHARFAVPWTQLMAGSMEDTLTFPATSADVLTMIRHELRPVSRPGDWRAGALIGQPVRVQDDDGFGTVGDLLFDRLGNLQAVAIDPAAGVGGPYAFPWDAVTVDPGLGSVTLSATADQVRALGAFEPARVSENVLTRR